MNAVNLIPRDSRTRRELTSVSPPTLALIGGMVVVLIAAVLYVTTANTVATRKSELAQVSSGVAGWTAAANSYASFVHAAERRTQQLADVRQLANSRFPWSDLLGQIGGLMPRRAALSTLTAATSAAAGTSATTAATAAASGPGVQLTGCAASQSVVAQTMVQLRLVKGVSGVTLSSTTDSSTGSGSASAGSSSSSQSSGGCPFPVQFQLSLAFTATAAAATATTGSATTATAPAPTATTTTPGAAQ